MGRIYLGVHETRPTYLVATSIIGSSLMAGILVSLAPLPSLVIVALTLTALIAIIGKPSSVSEILLIAGLVFYFWPVTSFGEIGIDLRVLGLGFFIVAGLQSGGLALAMHSTRNPGVRAHIVLMLAAASSVAWSVHTSQSVGAAQGAVGGGLSVLLIASVLSTSGRLTVVSRLVAVLGVLPNAVVWLAPGLSSDMYAGARFTGIFGNANGLGLFLAFVVAVLAFQPWPWRVALLLAVPMLVATGSRASVLAAVAGLFAPSLISGGARMGRRFGAAIALIAFAVGTVWVLHAPVEGERPLLLRATDSRTAHWEATWERFLASPIMGDGVGAWDSVFSVNSHLLLASELGLIGIALIVGFLTLLWSLVRRSNTPPFVIALIAVGGANSLFESWFYRGGSPYFVLFWSIVITASAYVDAPDRSQQGSRASLSTADGTSQGR